MDLSHLLQALQKKVEEFAEGQSWAGLPSFSHEISILPSLIFW